MLSQVHRVDITEPAQTLLRQLIEENGPVLFHHTDDDGTPICRSARDFRINRTDVLLARLTWHTEFWVTPDRFDAWRDTHLTLDVTDGAAADGSLEAGTGIRFVLATRGLTEAEAEALAAAPPPRTGADRTL